MSPTPTPRTLRRLALILAAAGSAALLLTACSAASDPTVSDQAASDPAVGTWGVDAEHAPQLVLSEDGSFTGTDGCNRLFGRWERGGDAVSFRDVGSTMMACPDVDTWLAGLDSARVESARVDSAGADRDTLHVFSAAGAEIGALARA